MSLIGIGGLGATGSVFGVGFGGVGGGGGERVGVLTVAAPNGDLFSV